MRLRALFSGFYLIATLSIASVPAAADVMAVPPAYVLAAETHDVPPQILYAVASAESVVRLGAGRRPWPWTLNVAGKGMRFKDRSSACHALRDALQETRIVDVGIAQLNVRWQPQLFGPGRRFADPCDGLNPYANLDEAAALLRRYFAESGDWLIAAGRYHRPAGGAPAARYRAVVRRELTLIGVGPSPGSALARDETNEAASGERLAANQPPEMPIEPITWVTPTPRPDMPAPADVTWVTPTKRPWTAEVAHR